MNRPLLSAQVDAHEQHRKNLGAARKVNATKVSVPLVQPAVGKVGAPTTNRFS